MKNLAIVFLTLFTAFNTLNAQENPAEEREMKTLFGNRNLHHGGYGGLTFGMDVIDGSYAFHSGFRAAWMIGHSFGLGFAGSGFSNNIEEMADAQDDFYSLSGGYGGILLEPVFAPRMPFHLSFPIVAGGGTVVNTRAEYYDDYDWDVYPEDESFFLMLQPGVELEMNLLKFLRLGAGVSWKFTTACDLQGKDRYLFDHPLYQVSLKFGKF